MLSAPPEERAEVEERIARLERLTADLTRRLAALDMLALGHQDDDDSAPTELLGICF